MNVDFNSTMVRLKEAIAYIYSKEIGFQFHYGSVKRVNRAFKKKQTWNFNSTMVRLKDRCHKGTGAHHKISIPLWFG